MQSVFIKTNRPGEIQKGSNSAFFFFFFCSGTHSTAYIYLSISTRRSEVADCQETLCDKACLPWIRITRFKKVNVQEFCLVDTAAGKQWLLMQTEHTGMRGGGTTGAVPLCRRRQKTLTLRNLVNITDVLLFFCSLVELFIFRLNVWREKSVCVTWKSFNAWHAAGSRRRRSFFHWSWRESSTKPTRHIFKCLGIFTQFKLWTCILMAFLGSVRQTRCQKHHGAASAQK